MSKEAVLKVASILKGEIRSARTKGRAFGMSASLSSRGRLQIGTKGKSIGEIFRDNNAKAPAYISYTKEAMTKEISNMLNHMANEKFISEDVVPGLVADLVDRVDKNIQAKLEKLGQSSPRAGVIYWEADSFAKAGEVFSGLINEGSSHTYLEIRDYLKSKLPEDKAPAIYQLSDNDFKKLNIGLDTGHGSLYHTKHETSSIGFSDIS